METTYNVLVNAGYGGGFASVNRPASDVTKLSNAVSYGSPVINWWQPEIKDCNGAVTQAGGYAINVGKDQVVSYQVSTHVPPAPCTPPSTGGTPTQPPPSFPGQTN